jgi:hypothetical protein
MKAKVPHWPLARVKELVAAGQVFVQRTRALDMFPSQEAAYVAAESTVAALTARSFAHSTAQAHDVCDGYGVVREGQGWYLKLCIDESVPEVAIISFHLLERPLRTNGGEVRPQMRLGSGTSGK